MSLAKEQIEIDFQNYKDRSFECSGCSQLIELDLEQYDSLKDLQDEARKLEEDCEVCENCKDREARL